jgi:hypothetical protein
MDLVYRLGPARYLIAKKKISSVSRVCKERCGSVYESLFEQFRSRLATSRWRLAPVAVNCKRTNFAHNMQICHVVITRRGTSSLKNVDGLIQGTWK